MLALFPEILLFVFGLSFRFELWLLPALFCCCCCNNGLGKGFEEFAE
jgi:hypothetical protein